MESSFEDSLDGRGVSQGCRWLSKMSKLYWCTKETNEHAPAIDQQEEPNTEKLTHYLESI
jgi:hypothetical protein